MQLNGQGFVLSEAEREHFRALYDEALDRYIRPYMNGRDLVQSNQKRFAVDLYPLSVETVRSASEPLDAKGLAAQFKRVKTTEKKVGEVLASLARHGRKFGSLTIVNPFVESAP
jgi:hypothetical protein